MTESNAMPVAGPAAGSAGAAQPQSLRLPRYAQCGMPVFLVFLAFVVVRYVQAGERMDLLRTIRFEFLLGGLSIILAIIQMSGRKPRIGTSRALLISICLLFFCLILQLPFAADPIIARRIFNDRAFKFAMLAFLIVAFVESPTYMKLFLGAFLFSIFYITLESVEGLISGGLYWENQGVMRLHGAVPLYGHPNSLGGVALGTLPYVVYLWHEIKPWYMRLGLLASSATAITCIIYSGSRTAYVGIVGLVLWMFYISDRKWRFLVRAAIVGTIVVMIVPQQYIERFESIGGQEKEGKSKETRIEILRDAVTIFAENPLGIGVASFPAKRMERFGREQDTHNLYLEVATNLGIQGFIVFVFLVGSMMRTLRRVAIGVRRQRAVLAKSARGKTLAPAMRREALAHDKNLRLLIAVSHATGGFIFVRLVLGLFGMDLYEIYWWFGAGLTISMSGMAESMLARTRYLVDVISKSAGGRPEAGF